MKQIYDFGRHTPPALNERMLREALERRSLRRQTVGVVGTGAIGSCVILLLAAFVLLAYSAMDWYPLITWLCLGYVAAAVAGGGVIAVVYSRKGGKAA